MTPNAASASCAPSRRSSPGRRSFLASTAVAAAAGGMPLLTACGGGQEGRKEGTTSGKAARKILPAYVASSVVAPDIPAKNGSAAGFTKAVALDRLKTSVPEKLGSGGELTVMAPLWGAPRGSTGRGTGGS